MYKLIKRLESKAFYCVNSYLFVVTANTSPIYIYDLQDLSLHNKLDGDYGPDFNLLNKYLVNESFCGVNIDTLTPVSLYNDDSIYYGLHNAYNLIIRKFTGLFECNGYVVDKMTRYGNM